MLRLFFFHGLRIEEYIVLIIIVFDFLGDLKFAVWNRRNGGEGIRFFERIFFRQVSVYQLGME